ncbi:Sugar phosphate permease [Pseudomonas sp. NFACC23-1]|uniref:MFS transporter n=1 Tax=unclassified Pseudomonas TaxID=196821 RepID=UPI00088476FA|nr:MULTISPECIES: MFS transporter [unclassified Pseudomonas]SDB04538.1 Sugar phosphate permease [Pseudomonas sp. NFACC17-2]SEI79323.1 Sugar phosphate permease [Pseudomonas sp. NFACC23-1]SFW19369.1 Sugar phosphate permease [Pseudomonas sp. NFACC16-2]
MQTSLLSNSETHHEHVDDEKKKSMKNVVAGSLFGTALETYDLYLYGTAAALIFAPLFFPGTDEAVSRLASLASFAISFVARPLGSLVLGHFGDRIGRKKLLYLTLIIMGLSTVGIGLLPTYASVGIWAPIMLCVLRFIQGFAFAGEYSGAVLMLLEHAPRRKRGFYAAINNIGPVFGFIASAGLLLIVSSLLSVEDFYRWGWRIPFIASLALLVVGVFVRSKVAESPVFEKTAEKRAAAKGPNLSPAMRLFTKYPKQLLLVAGANICHFSTFYLFTVFALSYGQKELGLSNAFVLAVAMVAICTHLVIVPFAGAMADRLGRRTMMLIGFAVTALAAFPFWHLFSTGQFLPMVLGSCLFMAGYGLVYGAVPSFTGEAFGPSARFTGFAMATNVGGIIGGGTAPIVGAYLLSHYGSPYAISVYTVVLAAISALCVYLSAETRTINITDE